MAEEKVTECAEMWLILEYLPVSLFSLRMTHATNKGGKTLLVPTPYVFKMTVLDACFRVFEKNEAGIKARQVFDLIKRCEIRFNPPPDCIVQNTFIKIRQEERDAPRGYYVPTITYREFCFYNNGVLKVAIEISGFSKENIEVLRFLGRHINCIGKKGSYWQYVGDLIYEGKLSNEYTFPQANDQQYSTDVSWSQYLDDFGKELCEAKDGFDRVSTYGRGKIELGKHRVLVNTSIPYRFKRASLKFTQYEKVI